MDAMGGRGAALIPVMAGAIERDGGGAFGHSGAIAWRGSLPAEAGQQEKQRHGQRAAPQDPARKPRLRYPLQAPMP